MISYLRDTFITAYGTLRNATQRNATQVVIVLVALRCVAQSTISLYNSTLYPERLKFTHIFLLFPQLTMYADLHLN